MSGGIIRGYPLDRIDEASADTATGKTIKPVIRF
jgi:hypothetical protein